MKKIMSLRFFLFLLVCFFCCPVTYLAVTALQGVQSQEVDNTSQTKLNVDEVSGGIMGEVINVCPNVAKSEVVNGVDINWDGEKVTIVYEDRTLSDIKVQVGKPLKVYSPRRFTTFYIRLADDCGP